MGRKDTVTKDYMKQNTIFADAFNYYIYGGQQRILPGQLQKLLYPMVQMMPESRSRFIGMP